jgi:hypothetical protein
MCHRFFTAMPISAHMEPGYRITSLIQVRPVADLLPPPGEATIPFCGDPAA